MRRIKYPTNAALAVPVLALLLAGAVIAGSIGGGDQNQDVEPGGDPPGGGDDCICPHIYDPVVCTHGGSGTIIGPAPTYEKFSNGCFAGCAGYTAEECRPAPEEVR